MSVNGGLYCARNEKAVRKVEERQAPLLTDKATLTGETTEDLLAIVIR